MDNKIKNIKIVLAVSFVSLVVLLVRIIPLILKISTEEGSGTISYAYYFGILISIILFLIACGIIASIFSLGVISVHKKINKNSAKTYLDYFSVIYIILTAAFTGLTLFGSTI